jgi:hypothetical protein
MKVIVNHSSVQTYLTHRDIGLELIFKHCIFNLKCAPVSEQSLKLELSAQYNFKISNHCVLII